MYISECISGGLNMVLRFALCLFIAIFVSGCAIGNTTNFDIDGTNTTVQTDKTVAVGTLDIRSYIVSKDKTPDFVGLQRGGFGNPFDVTTTSKAPLSEDITASLISALRKNGVDATPVSSVDDGSYETVVSSLVKINRQRSILMIVNELKSDTFYNTAFLYDLRLQVLDESGKRIAESAVQGRDNLGPLGLPSDVGVAVTSAFQRNLESLLSDPAVVDALK
jgi:hypothetical protein